MNKSSEQVSACPTAGSECACVGEIAKLRSHIEELEKLASIDALTGLYNFRHFKAVLQAEMDGSKRSGIPATLVMVDLDYFKKVNDSYGHEGGNLALKHVADIIKGEIRATDWVCRYGGDEFAILFPETHLNLAIKVCERIRELIAASPVKWENGKFHITASMGASVYMKASTIGIDTFVGSVDKYLYEAKHSGRNCICHVDCADLLKVTEIGTDERSLYMTKNTGQESA